MFTSFMFGSVHFHPAFYDSIPLLFFFFFHSIVIGRIIMSVDGGQGRSWHSVSVVHVRDEGILSGSFMGVSEDYTNTW